MNMETYIGVVNLNLKKPAESRVGLVDFNLGPDKIYRISGVTFLLSTPCSAKLVVIKESTGEVVDTAISDLSTGEYFFDFMSDAETYTIVAWLENLQSNAICFSHVKPLLVQ